jgi:predicted phage terminase large subunit-like protein
LLPESQREQVIRSLTAEDAERLAFEWRFWARPNQLAPDGDWRVWLLLAGRGFGKTRAAGEWVRERVDGGARHLILAGATASDVRDIMIEGESGILAISPPWNRPKYEPSKARVTWPSGARAMLLSADEPERFRGKQCDTFWSDELGAWRYPEAWDQMWLGFRLGAAYGVTPRGIVSTTPRPTPTIRSLIADERSTVTRGSTFDNIANLAPAFIEAVRAKYEGTRLGRQELYAEVLDDVEGALWSRDMIDKPRIRPDAAGNVRLPEFVRTVVAIDPAVTATETSDETGIVVAGMAENGHVYVLADVSGKMSPLDWARKSVKAYNDHRCDRIVAEENNGGKLVEANLRTILNEVPYKGVRASQGKRTRAEPIAALYEQGKVHHVGNFAKLEDQMCTWEPLTGDKSPDRLDALVWAVTELAFTPRQRRDLSLLDQ